MKKLWQIFKGGLLIIIIMGVLFLRTLSMDYFMLSSIDFPDSPYVNAEEFIEETGLVLDQHLLKYSTGDKLEILEKNPYIKEAKISKELPNRLWIQLKEREKYAIIPYSGKFLTVDYEGVVLESNDSIIVGDLPIFRGFNVQGFQKGRPLEMDRLDTLLSSFLLYEALSQTSIFEDIIEIIAYEEDIIVETSQNIDLVFDKGVDVPTTVVAVEEIYDELLSRGQRNYSIIGKYDGYLYTEVGTYQQRKRLETDPPDIENEEDPDDEADDQEDDESSGG